MSTVLPTWGNKESMNLNSLLLNNIRASQYFKVNLYEKKTYQDVVDEIYYQVKHLEPWERRKSKNIGINWNVRRSKFFILFIPNLPI